MNKFPEAKRFVKEAGHADSYEGLKVNYIPGHTPELVLFDDDGQETERIDITKYKTTELHDLMGSKGFSRKPGSPAREEL